MSMSRVTAFLTILVTVCFGAPRAEAQRELHHVPPVINPDGSNPDYLHPFVEPLAFQPDFQFFAPADFDTFGGGPDPNTGWFATYDRIYMWVSRPEHVAAYEGGDTTWGNRFDVGYMTDEDHGWLFSFWHIDGPNNANYLVQERINVYNTQDEINGTPRNTVFFRGGGTTGGTGAITRNVGLPDSDGNNPLTKGRDYFLNDTINIADLTSIELNKTLRWKPLHYGSVVEPFVGFRYAKFDDRTQQDSYIRYNGDGSGQEWPPNNDPLVFPKLPVDVANLDAASVEQLVSQQTKWENQMVGGQLGLRWYKLKGRWDLSGEVRAFVFQNFQSFNNSTNVETTYYAGTAADDQVTYVFYDRQSSDDHDAEFVFGGEVRAEAAYAVSKYIAVRCGMSFMDFGKGIARGPAVIRNDEDVQMVGFSFGATVNR